jgi:hypothetical protein
MTVDDLTSLLSRCTVLPTVGNNLDRGNPTEQDVLRELGRRLPGAWEISSTARLGHSFPGTDLLVRVKGPDGKEAIVAFELKREVRPFDVPHIAGRLRQRWPVADRLVVAAPYLSPAARDRLQEQGISFVDLTGNTRLELSQPGLFIEAQGAQVDPERRSQRSRSLRGPKAGRVVRLLLESRPPPGVRDIATQTGVDAGYVSRLVAGLEREALLKRKDRGRIVSVDWPRLLRRWAEEAPLESRGRQRTYLEPRGIKALLGNLRETSLGYAITGSLAAAKIAPVAPTRLAIVYVDQLARAEKDLSLRAAETGANVLLVEPKDPGVYAGARSLDNLRYVAPSQAAADLLTSPGRGPAEAEELIRWLTDHEDAWRG